MIGVLGPPTWSIPAWLPVSTVRLVHYKLKSQQGLVNSICLGLATLVCWETVLTCTIVSEGLKPSHRTPSFEEQNPVIAVKTPFCCQLIQQLKLAFLCYRPGVRQAPSSSRPRAARLQTYLCLIPGATHLARLDLPKSLLVLDLQDTKKAPKRVQNTTVHFITAGGVCVGRLRVFKPCQPRYQCVEHSDPQSRIEGQFLGL